MERTLIELVHDQLVIKKYLKFDRRHTSLFENIS
jgi:hypothetical protein